MHNIRYFIRLINAYLTRFKAILFLGIIIGILIFFTIRFVAPFFLNKNIERIGYTGRYQSDNLPSDITEFISQGLTKVSKDFNIEPNIAGSWESPDKGKTWTFHLKDNIYWQDGEIVDSNSISYSFSDVRIEKPDKKTIVFYLDNNFSPFPAVLSKPIFKKGLLGTGEWEVKKMSLAGNIIQRLELTDKKGNKKIFRFYPTEERTKLAYKLGEVDKIYNIIDPTPLDSWKTVKISVTPNKNQYIAVFFNTTDTFLSEKSIRQSLAYAIDKDSLNLERSYSPISPNSWAFNPQVKPYNFDKERSIKLLESIPKEKIENNEIRLSTTPPLLNIAERIKKYWDEIGIKTNVQVTNTIPSDYQAFLAIFDIPKDPDQYALWHSTQDATNITKYDDPRVDKLLEDGRIELDLEQRRKIYLDFQRFLIEDSPAIFLFHPNYFHIERK